MTSFDKLLAEHKSLSERRINSTKALIRVQNEFESCEFFEGMDLQVFCAGSLGRGDAGERSDLDLFVVTNRENIERLEELEILAKLIELNRKLDYPPFSNDGMFLKIQSLTEMTNLVGDPSDDVENLFTTRMLLLLESKPILNEGVYNDHVTKIMEHYFRDKEGHPEFAPIFLLNDILRYWRTLCLNYERIRNDPKRSWRKKNVNLKFSRALTVFSTILAIVVRPDISIKELVDLTKITPLERFSLGLNDIGDAGLMGAYSEFLDIYENFLRWKEDESIEGYMSDPENKKMARECASKFTDFLYAAVTHDAIDGTLKKCLVI